ncbi:MAG: DUF4082 domain-containing protein [Actinobacteria bacterium]|nr:DUF4082 domain-containing protein [Actinomycetota bacterium]
MSFIKRARRARVSRTGIALVAALALGTTSAAVWSSATASAATVDTIWGTSAPAQAAVDSDTGSVELGTRFTASTTGQATAVRFYKTPENRGTHTGSLWTSTGSLIGKVTFSNETSTGWQSATFAKPIQLNAGTSYVVSYHASYGRYVATERFSGSSVSTSLTTPSSNVGVYAYGSTSKFPTNSWQGSNYWVDLSFAPGVTSGAALPLATATSATSTSTATTTPTTSSTSTTVAPSPTATSTTPKPTTSTSSAPAPTATAPTATATASTTTSSSGLTSCVSLPSRCGYPDATNTGIPAGTVLKRVPADVTSGPGWVWDSRGWLQANSGAVVSNVIVSGSINMAGSNVTVTNTRVLVGGESWGIGLQHATNAVISNSEIGVPGGTPRLMVGIKDIYGDSTGTQVLRNNVTNSSTGIQIYGGLIADNYVHDLGYQTGDHINGTTSNGSTDMMTIRHNTILNRFDQTDAISLFQDFGIEANRLITNNLVAGGGYTIYGGDNQRYGKTYNIQITNNRFSKLYYPNSGSYGPITAFDPSGANNLASGNYWDENLSAVNA